MAVTEYHASDGTAESILWTDVPNAFDGNIATFAVYTPPFLSKDPTEYLLADEWILDSTSAPDILDIITKVEVGYLVIQANTPTFIYGRPVFNGIDGTSEVISAPTVALATTYLDVTNEPNAPESWTWTDVANLNSKVWVQNTNDLKNYAANIFIFWKRITHEAPPIPDYAQKKFISKNDTYRYVAKRG